LGKSGASSSGPPPKHRDIDAEVAAAFITLQSFLPETLIIESSSANSPKPRYIILEISLKFQASLVADLVFTRTFNDAQTWHRCVGQYMSVWLNDEQAVTYVDSLRMDYLAIDKVRDYPIQLSVSFSQHFYYIVKVCCSS
jgi:elongation factor 3